MTSSPYSAEVRPTGGVFCVTEVLYRSLQMAVVQQAAHYDDPVPFLIRQADSPDNDSVLHFRMGYRGLPYISVRLAVTRIEGSVYEVVCEVDGGDSQRYSYGVDDKSGVRLSYAPFLGRKLADFLLGELKRHLGEALVKSPAGPPRSSASLMSRN